MIKDYFGEELKIGDEVIFMCTGVAREFRVGTITRMTAKMVVIVWSTPNRVYAANELKQFGHQVIKRNGGIK